MGKFKLEKNIRGYIPVIATVIIFFFILIMFGLAIALKALGVIMLAFSLIFGFWSYHKTRNHNFLASAFYLISFGLLLLLLELPSRTSGSTLKFSGEIKVVFMFFLISLIWVIYIGLRKKMKYRGIEVMELAARDVDPAPNAYTERPRPAGKVDYSKEDIIDFGNHLKQHLICIPFQEEHRIVLVPVRISDYLDLLFNPKYNYYDKTWVAFDFEGQVSAHISKSDFLNYKEDLAFDQLCESLGQVFINFAEFFMKGDKSRIIDRLDSVKLGLFA